MKPIVFYVIIVILAASTSHAKDWRGIIPLHSTRGDVERLLGPPTMDRSDMVVYEFPTERASIEFSKGPCNVEFSPWNVPRDVVISIWVTPKSDQLNTADLNLNQNAIVKTRDDHRPQISYYLNKLEGIEYTVNEEIQRVDLIKYLPPASDERFRCPEPRNRLTETINFAHYSNISFRAEKKILDRFAKQIIRHTSINYASAQAYIFAYGREGQIASSAMSRAERARRYLIEAKQIEANRIEVVNAGSRKKSTIELYLVPPGVNPPRLGSPFPQKHN